MRLEMDTDLVKKCTLDLSPNTVLPPPRKCSSREKRYPNGKSGRKDENLMAKEAFTEISFRRYRSASCKNVPCRSVGAGSSAELKRGSVYQSSKEVTKMKKTGTVEGRKKIELSRSSDTYYSFRVVDSLCNFGDENLGEINSVVSAGSKLKSASTGKPYFEPCSSDGFIEICLSSDNKGSNKREKQLEETVGIHNKRDISFGCEPVVRPLDDDNRRDISFGCEPVVRPLDDDNKRDIGFGCEPVVRPLDDDNKRDISFGCEPVVRPLDDGNDLVEKDTVRNLHKSQSAKVEASSPEDQFSRTSSRARFNHIRKMFDPFMKSKSLRSPLGYAGEAECVKNIRMENTRRNKTFRKSLLHDFSHRPRNCEPDSVFIRKESIHSTVASSPVHLHGCLKVGAKHGVPFFEFSMNQQEDVVFLAKQWKQDNAFNWVYTFHSVGNRKKSNVSMRGLSVSSKDSLIVAQMQVSCCLCSEIKEGEITGNSMVTEFVLYDIAHARQRVSLSIQGSPDVCKTPACYSPSSDVGHYESDDGSNAVKLKDHLNVASDSDEVESLNGSTPLLPASLHPNLEIAAIVVQVPFKKRESLKYRRGDKIGDYRHLNLLNVSMIEECKSNIKDRRTQEKVKVVLPNGNHGFPTETLGPSSLLDRWRKGGGCDCGGWDMACPLVVFDNPGINCSQDQPMVDSEQPFELFLQGAKETAPALTLTAIEGGYAVDFHAKLSALQAFSICVSILHGTETPAAATATSGEAQTKNLSQCNSLKSLIADEMKFLIEEVTKEERKKVGKRAVPISPFYVINPPFSPIARV